MVIESCFVYRYSCSHSAWRYLPWEQLTILFEEQKGGGWSWSLSSLPIYACVPAYKMQRRIWHYGWAIYAVSLEKGKKISGNHLFPLPTHLL